jgi:hypothetical protein
MSIVMMREIIEEVWQSDKLRKKIVAASARCRYGQNCKLLVNSFVVLGNLLKSQSPPDDWLLFNHLAVTGEGKERFFFFFFDPFAF